MELFAIFAKQPRPGQAKTRLADATSPEFAQAVAEAMLGDTVERFRRLHTNRAIVYAPLESEAYFKAMAGDGYACVPQTPGDLGARLKQFIDQQQLRGLDRIIIIGSDSPTLPVEYVEQAFGLLETNDVVIGPAVDGGFYLLGVGATEVPIFDGMPWSTAGVLDATVARLQTVSARLSLLPPWYDVDSADDWRMLCGHVRAMRLAGIDPGVPRVERLMAESEQGAPS